MANSAWLIYPAWVLKRTKKALIGGVAAAVDQVATRAAYAQSARRRKGNRAESLSHEQRVDALGKLAQRYTTVSSDNAFFRGPRAIEPRWQQVRTLSGGGRLCDLRWASRYEAFLPEMRERYESKIENREAGARLSLHAEPRPVAILIHGYMGGQYGVEERMWPVRWLYRIGLDLAVFVLPFHGVRAIRDRAGPPPFPGSDPRLSNEGFRQAMGDLRDLVAWLRERGHPEIGLMGMSLGGYTASLAATLESELAFVTPVIPLTSLADFARAQGRLGSNEQEASVEHALLDEVHRVVSPLHRKPVVEARRMLIVAAEADRITPLAHARRLAAHFDAPLETWPGGHLLQLGRGEKFRRIGRFLNELGVIRRP